jgi:hypothetical protein
MIDLRPSHYCTLQQPAAGQGPSDTRGLDRGHWESRLWRALTATTAIKIMSVATWVGTPTAAPTSNPGRDINPSCNGWAAGLAVYTAYTAAMVEC